MKFKRGHRFPTDFDRMNLLEYGERMRNTHDLLRFAATQKQLFT